MTSRPTEQIKARLLHNPLEGPIRNESSDPLREAVRAEVDGMRMLVVSNRKDRRLEKDLAAALGVEATVVDAAGRPRRLRSVADSIQAGCCDLVVATTGFMSHSDERTLMRAAKSADVPYVRTRNDSVSTIVRAIARDMGLARVANPERWLAPKLDEAKRARLKQLHDLYFPMFTEIETLPGAPVSTPTAFYQAPEGYAMVMQIGEQRFMFFQDAEPAETWTVIEVGQHGASDRMEHVADYLAVLESINDRVARHVRRANLTTLDVAGDALGATLGDEVAGVPGAIAGGIVAHELTKRESRG